MSKELLIVIIVSEIISIFLLFRTWRSQEYLVFKIFATVIVVIPIVGPILYLFVANTPNPQAKDLQNNLPRGYYTQSWISQQAARKKASNGDGCGEKNEHT